MTERVTLADIGNELRPYPGRDWMVLRIVIGVFIATVLVMAFQIESGWLSLYFCFVFAAPTTKQTLLTGVAVLVVSFPVIILSLLLLKYVVEPTWLRLLALAAVLYGAFFLANIMTNGSIVTNLTILFATVLTFPDVYAKSYIWEEATFWLLPMVGIGVLSVSLATLLIRPEKALPAQYRPAPIKYGFLADRWSNPEHRVYALKCTLASMATYFIYTALNFQEIQTALMTCLILALPTTKEIIHKTWLRITGAMIGAGMAMTAAIWIIPQSNAMWLLLVVVGAGSAIAAWVALSSPRISYAGRQMALAQFMLITHSFGPASDLTVLRDRLLGILLGNIMMGVTFKYLWPQKDTAVAALAKALPVIAVGMLALTFTGCRSSEALAPQSPSRPWRSAATADYALPREYANPDNGADFDPQHEYTLPELADLALRNNPKTRIAWEQARTAAAGVGAAESLYYPQLNLMVAAGYEYLHTPLPKSIFAQGYFYSDVVVLRPELQLEWLLWDFGRRGSGVTRAKEMAVAQNFAFNAQHQQLLFSVCSAYYKLVSLRSSLAVTEAAEADAKTVEQAAKASLKQGFATNAELLQAQQQVAQYAFDTTALKADLRKAQVALAESVGLDPGLPLRVRSVTEIALPETLSESVNTLVERAFADRPGLKAMVASLRAAEASVEEARAQAWPQLVLTANGGPTYNAFSVEDSRWDSSFAAQYGFGLAVRMPIFDGFRRRQQTIAALAQKRQAQAEIAEARNATVREVWEAYTDFESAMSQLRAAQALVAASEASSAATLASFKQGFASVVDVQTQQAGLIKARESYNQARTDIFLSASLLQYVTGQLSLETIAPAEQR